MKNKLKLTLIALLALGIAQTRALAVGPVTNVVQTVSFLLTVFTEGEVVTNGSVVTKPVLKLKIATKDVIEALGTGTGNNFSAKAKLILVTPLDGDESSIFVQDGTNKVDVSELFSVDDVGSTEVQGSSENTISGAKTATDYSIIRLRLRDHDTQILPAHFELSGLSTDKSAGIVIGGIIRGKSHQITLNLAGTGDFTDGTGTHSFIATGTVTVTGKTLSVEP
jgi:hypothetical protein